MAIKIKFSIKDQHGIRWSGTTLMKHDATIEEVNKIIKYYQKRNFKISVSGLPVMYCPWCLKNVKTKLSKDTGKLICKTCDNAGLCKKK